MFTTYPYLPPFALLCHEKLGRTIRGVLYFFHLSVRLENHSAGGRDVASFCAFSFTGPARQLFQPPSPYPPLSEKCRNITTIIFRLSMRKRVFMGTRRETLHVGISRHQPIIVRYSKGFRMVTPPMLWPEARSSESKSAQPAFPAVVRIRESQKEYP